MILARMPLPAMAPLDETLTQKHKRLALFILAALLLTGCSRGSQTSDRAALVTQANIAATATAAAPATPVLTDLARPVDPPTAVPTQPPTATSTPTATPSPSPTATPSPSPTATPLPHVQLARGRWLQEIGDYAAARKEFAGVIAQTSAASANQSAIVAEARYRLAQCYLADEAYPEAAAVLAQLLATAPTDDPHRGPAAFLLGQALLALGRPADAEAAFRQHLAQVPELAYLTWQRIAAARRAAGDLAAAADAYTSALAQSPDSATTVNLRRALADLALARRDFAAAVAQYDALRAGATTGALAAEMQLLAGRALAQAGDQAGAIVRWRAAAAADPTTSYAHQAIVALLDAGAAVDDYQRGLINYHNGVHALAVAAFDRLLANADPTARNTQDAIYYRSLSYLALGQTDRGIAELDRFIAAYPQHPLWAEAWLAKARSQARAGNRSGAIATYRRLAELRPDAPQAPRALWQAVNLHLQAGETEAAAETALALGRRYPASDEGWRAYQVAGLARYRSRAWQAAADIFTEMAAAGVPAFARPLASFWLGMAQAAGGNQAAARRTWEAVAQAGPETFFGLRAAARLRDMAGPWGTGRLTAAWRANAGNTEATSADEAALAAWLATWAGQGTLTLPDAVRKDADWRQGTALRELGYNQQASAAWERVQRRFAGEPWTQVSLALAFRDAGAHRLSIAAAESVLARWGGPLSAAPLALQRLAYPLPYRPLLTEEAARRQLDPRLLAAVIRQESRFEPAATSRAGAQGLMQVMPATADWIASRLGERDFEAEQAYRPYVNVAFGAFYLDYALKQLNDSLPAALAGYNGGPGNAARWQAQSGGDEDLFAALIDLSETRVYVQTVWTQYQIYQRIYPTD